MKNSRISLIFNSFSKKEIRELRKWLISPVHNQRQDVRDLFEYLAKNKENYREKAFEKEYIFIKLFPGENYDDARFRQTIHFSVKAFEEFLIYKEMREDHVRSFYTLAKVYRKRKLDKLFESTMNSARDAQQKYPYRNEHFLRNEFLLQLEDYAKVESRGRTVEMNIQEVVDSLENSFLADKLRYSCMMLAHRAVYKTEYQFGILDPILEYVEQERFLQIPAIAVYYYGYKTQTDESNPEHFENLKKVIFENASFFPKAEGRDIYLMAINFLVKKLNTGSKPALRELFELYKNGLENQVFIENGNLSRFTFMNVVALGLKLSEFKWVESFVETNQIYLSEKYRDNIVHFSTANLAYEKRDFPTAMQQLTQVEYDDILMNLNAKSMLIRMFYEEDEFDALESLLSSTSTYLTRKKVMGYHKSNLTNLIKITKMLLKINPYDKSQIEKLRGKIEEAKPMASAEREWLLRQLDSL